MKLTKVFAVPDFDHEVCGKRRRNTAALFDLFARRPDLRPQANRCMQDRRVITLDVFPAMWILGSSLSFQSAEANQD